jgi:CheY-like chemotaxis protein
MPQANDKVLKIFLAEDDQEDRELFKEAMKEIPNEIKLSTAKDGIELLGMLDRARNNLPDLIFLDLNMPKKDGHQCLVEIKSDSLLQQIPVIIYSTSARPEQINSTYKEGANLYIAKPDSYNKLKSIIENVVSLNWFDYIPQPTREKFVLQ